MDADDVDTAVRVLAERGHWVGHETADAESVRVEIRRAARNNKPVGAIMIDLDHFKRFNDTFGHEAGDMLLREFGNLARVRTRKEDIACRYGGEEFLMLLPGAAAAEAHAAKRAGRNRVVAA